MRSDDSLLIGSGVTILLILCIGSGLTILLILCSQIITINEPREFYLTLWLLVFCISIRILILHDHSLGDVRYHDEPPSYTERCYGANTHSRKIS